MEGGREEGGEGGGERGGEGERGSERENAKVPRALAGRGRREEENVGCTNAN